jgi:hypothetical protein
MVGKDAGESLVLADEKNPRFRSILLDIYFESSFALEFNNV